MTWTKTLRIAAVVALAPSSAFAAIKDWCSPAEQVGDVLPGATCSSHLALMAEVASAAVPCWEQISEDLLADEWLAARAQCEAQAHFAVCGQAACF